MSQTSSTLRDVAEACLFTLCLCLLVCALSGVCLLQYLWWRVSDGAA